MKFHGIDDFLLYLGMAAIPFLIGRAFGNWKSSVVIGVITNIFLYLFFSTFTGFYMLLALAAVVIGVSYNVYTKQKNDPVFKAKLNSDMDYLNELEEKNKLLKETKKQNIQHIDCPNCHSKNIQHVSNNKKGFSIGKALGGTLLAGGIGSLAGFAGKKGKRDRWICQECGTVFNK